MAIHCDGYSEREVDEVEQLRGLLRDIEEFFDAVDISPGYDIEMRMAAALSQQAEPVAPAPAQDEREAMWDAGADLDQINTRPAQIEQQPAAWRWLYDGQPDGPYAFNYPLPSDDVIARGLAAERPRTVQPLYAAPVAQPEQSELVEALHRVKLTDEEARHHSATAVAYWNNAVTACIAALSTQGATHE